MMTENERILSALADEVNVAHAALSELNVPTVLEGEPLSLPERIAWLNMTRPRPAGEGAPVTETADAANVVGPRRGPERSYRVRWEIDVTAASRTSAALKARRVQLQPDSDALEFEVVDHDGAYPPAWELADAIDLAEMPEATRSTSEEPEERPRRPRFVTPAGREVPSLHDEVRRIITDAGVEFPPGEPLSFAALDEMGLLPPPPSPDGECR